MKILYFTTTGNSLAVARAIGGELLSVVGLLVSGVGGLRDDDGVGVVCPVYFGELPLPVSELLSRIVIDAPYRFLVLTCGSTPAMAVRASGGWDYVRSILMVDNYFPMFDVGEQIAGVGQKRVDEHLAEICADISMRRRFVESPTVFGRLAGWWMRCFPLRSDAYRRFYVEDSCSGCGICARLCPVGNIVLLNGRPMIGEGCLTCGACYHNCPSAAVRYKGEKSRVQYRHPGVSLVDIMSQSGSVEKE
ncbi:EFR1 family ferrodoxin [Duncaniella freteri]|uniref:EFR1 family ferrodoxin n=1 Tax=Duncaniella freteri TaxID=2530391 RepID=UPI002557EBCA|nr:EFR1 family ferrodoxin [Duncaniella freteri]